MENTIILVLMFILIIYILLTIGFAIKYIISKKKEEKQKLVVKEDIYKYCDIIQLRDDRYASTYKNQYPFLTSYGAPSLHDTLSHFQIFETKQEAKDFLDKWLDMNSKSHKSVGIN